MGSYVGNINTPVRTLTKEEQLKLLKVTGEHVKGFRDHVIISIALSTGMRQFEILGLNMGDIYRNGKSMSRIQLRVFKKSADYAKNHHIVMLNRSVRAKLDKYYKWKKRNCHDITENAPLFISNQKKRLNDRTLRKQFKVWQERAGFDQILNFHQLRHTAATNIHNLTKDPRMVQKFTRHKDLRSVQIYTHPSDEDLAKAVEDLLC